MVLWWNQSKMMTNWWWNVVFSEGINNTVISIYNVNSTQMIEKLPMKISSPVFIELLNYRGNYLKKLHCNWKRRKKLLNFFQFSSEYRLRFTSEKIDDEERIKSNKLRSFIHFMFLDFISSNCFFIVIKMSHHRQFLYFLFKYNGYFEEKYFSYC